MGHFKQPILETTIRNTTGVGIHTKSIGQMCSKQKIEGKRCAIIWHVDELKISHASKDVVEDILTTRQIWTRKSTHNKSGKDPRIPRNVN